MNTLLQDLLGALNHSIEYELEQCPKAHLANEAYLAALEKRDVAEQIARLEEDTERVRLLKAWNKCYAH